MNKFSMAFFGLVFLCPLMVSAGDELDAINLEVEQRAVQLDHDFGLLLTSQERSALKLSLIANKMIADQSDASVKENIDKAISVYEIADPADQRQLLIIIESTGGGGGSRPPCCDHLSN